MFHNINGLSEEKECDQEILNLIDSLNKDIGIIVGSQLKLKEAQYLHCLKYRKQNNINQFVKINVGDEKNNFYIHLKISVPTSLGIKARLEGVKLGETADSPIVSF